MVLRLAQTAALASPLPPVPAFSPEFPANLAATVTSADRDRVEVSLDPVELGRLRFDIRHNGDLVQVNLSVERPETMDLMRRHADQLLAELRAAGFAGASLSFSQWGQGQADRNKPDAPPPPETAAPNGPVPAPTIPLRAAQTGQGLDLRL